VCSCERLEMPVKLKSENPMVRFHMVVLGIDGEVGGG
jgi:hypothetical protein